MVEGIGKGDTQKLLVSFYKSTDFNISIFESEFNARRAFIDYHIHIAIRVIVGDKCQDFT